MFMRGLVYLRRGFHSLHSPHDDTVHLRGCMPPDGQCGLRDAANLQTMSRW